MPSAFFRARALDEGESWIPWAVCCWGAGREDESFVNAEKGKINQQPPSIQKLLQKLILVTFLPDMCPEAVFAGGPRLGVMGLLTHLPYFVSVSLLLGNRTFISLNTRVAFFFSSQKHHISILCKYHILFFKSRCLDYLLRCSYCEFMKSRAALPNQSAVSSLICPLVLILRVVMVGMLKTKSSVPLQS